MNQRPSLSSKVVESLEVMVLRYGDHFDPSRPTAPRPEDPRPAWRASGRGMQYINDLIQWYRDRREVPPGDGS